MFHKGMRAQEPLQAVSETSSLQRSFVQTRGTIGSMRKGGRNVQGYRRGGVYS